MPRDSLLAQQILNNPLLESALNVPRQPFYRNRFHKAGVLLRSMIKNHPFVDGNKRIGVATTWVFLFMNSYALMPGNDELVEYALHIARSSPPPDWREIGQWLRERSVAWRPQDALATQTVRGQRDLGEFEALGQRKEALAAVLREVVVHSEIHGISRF